MNCVHRDQYFDSCYFNLYHTVFADKANFDIASEVCEVSFSKAHRLEHEQVAILVAAELGQNLHVVFYTLASLVDQLNVDAGAGCRIQARPKAVLSEKSPTRWEEQSFNVCTMISNCKIKCMYKL